MSKKNKYLLISSILLCLFSVLFITTYSFLEFSDSTNSLLMDTAYINMEISSSNDVFLTNIFPMDMDSALESDVNYIDFSVSGNNTSDSDVYYKFQLDYGNDIDSKTRIDSSYLRFSLENLDTGKLIFNGRKYFDYEFNNKTIYVNTFEKNNNSIQTYEYRLRVWIDNNIIIGSNENADYSISEWNDLFASVKVKVVVDDIPLENEYEYVTIPNDICREVKYNGETQQLTKSNYLEGIIITDNYGDLVDGYDIRYDLAELYKWGDGSTDYMTGSCYITQGILEIPESPSNKLYTGSSISSGISCPNGSVASGDLSATNAGTYHQICTLSDTDNYMWEDGTITPKSITWEIEGGLTSCTVSISNGYTGALAVTTVPDLPGTTFNWSTGGTGSSIKVNAGGTYSVTATLGNSVTCSLNVHKTLQYLQQQCSECNRATYCSGGEYLSGTTCYGSFTSESQSECTGTYISGRGCSYSSRNATSELNCDRAGCNRWGSGTWTYSSCSSSSCRVADTRDLYY